MTRLTEKIKNKIDNLSVDGNDNFAKHKRSRYHKEQDQETSTNLQISTKILTDHPTNSSLQLIESPRRY